MNEATVTQRAQQILKILVERYIQEGNPVGSRTLAEEYALGLSPATIRNILGDLEELGYLVSPHTSAGRIPTERGYRFFVDSLLTVRPVNTADFAKLQNELDPDLMTPHLLQSASTLLSSITHLTGIVSFPRRDRIELRQIEFLPLSANRVLVIFVLNNREVQNRIIYTDRCYSQSELQQAANYLNAHYSGKELLLIRKELLDDMQNDRAHLAKLIEVAIDVANKAFADAEQEQKDFVMTGQNHLVQCTQEGNLERLRLLFEAFTCKQDILNLLDHSLEAEGVQIFIGKETGHDALNECSIVTASYSVEGQLVGSLGVIGPTRMAYDRVISAVDVTAKLLSSALNQN